MAGIRRNLFSRKFYHTDKIYRVWCAMRRRCHNKSILDYARYGGRGIKICDRWQEFSNFNDDMRASYKDGLTLDRIDNNGDYSPENCRWATLSEQALNTKNVELAKRITFKGVKKTIREWAEEYGLNRSTLDVRLSRYKWPIRKALETRPYGWH